jgi:hypothetical protein
MSGVGVCSRKVPAGGMPDSLSGVRDFIALILLIHRFEKYFFFRT